MGIALGQAVLNNLAAIMAVVHVWFVKKGKFANYNVLYSRLWKSSSTTDFSRIL
jgi:hypothetical protein